MATEYKLPYVASEISRKLATVDETKNALENNYYASAIVDSKLSNKADLVDGKIPVSQLPYDQSDIVLMSTQVTHGDSTLSDIIDTIDEKISNIEIPEGSSVDCDDVPTQGSENPVKSGGVHAALKNKADLIGGKIPFEQLPDEIGDSSIGVLRDGVAIKKIVFTDRPSFYQWLLLNYHKSIYCNIIWDRYPHNTRFIVHRCVQWIDGMPVPSEEPEFELVQIAAMPHVTLIPSYAQITSTHVTYRVDEYINVNPDGTVTGESHASGTLSDEDWEYMNVRITVHYFGNEFPSVDISQYYTKAEVDADYYTKSEIDNIALNGTVNLSDYYTKSETNATLASKADLVNGKIPIGQLPVGIGSGASSEAIIDVASLPTEGINPNAFYRLLTATVMSGAGTFDEWVCHCVDGLPEIGAPCTNEDITAIVAYYNVQDNAVYGYVDDMLSMVLGVPSGWYDMGMLLAGAGFVFGGIITDEASAFRLDELYVLLEQHLYMYQDGWVEMVFARNKKPKIDISWDGVVGDKFALDLSALGFEGMQYVKVSDEVPTVRDILGCEYSQIFADGSSYENEIADDFVEENSQIDMDTYPGAMSIDGGVMIIIYSADDSNAALGLPEGYLTNGVYFLHSAEGFYTNRLIAPSRISKIGSEYVDANMDEVWENINWIYDRLNNLYYTKSEIDSLIANAISGAIGGSY